MPVPFRLGPECGCPGMCSNFRLAGESRQVWKEVEHVMVLKILRLVPGFVKINGTVI